MELYEKPQKPRVIIGFPGFGLIGTITTEFLRDHLETKKIGSIFFDGLPANLAVHNGEMLDPIGIYHNEKYNIVLINGLVSSSGLEWKISEEINKVLEELDPYEIIDVEGIASQKKDEESKVYFFTKDEEKAKRFSDIGLEQMKEGIIIGITSSLLLKVKRDVSCFFAETHSELPDSKGAAKIIQAIDKHMELEVDYKPLLEQAKIFEQKLKGIMQKGSQAKKEADKKAMNYVG
ncbi:MAG: proteasome assembly chaperone family protein [Nanobdellota archaeon]